MRDCAIRVQEIIKRNSWPGKHSMPEMPYAGHHHGYALLIRCSDYFRIAHAAAGLDHRPCPCLHDHIQTIAKREKGIRCHGRAIKAESRIPCLDRGNARAIHAAHLSGPHPERLAVNAEYDSI